MPGFHRSGGGDRGGYKKSFSGSRDGGRPMMHKATCGDCGRPCEVPFKPSPDRPVFCNNCFKKEEGGGKREYRNDRRDDRRETNSSAPSKDQFTILNNKLDEILKILNTAVSTDEEDEEYDDDEE